MATRSPGLREAVRVGAIAAAAYAAVIVLVALTQGGGAQWFVKFGDRGHASDVAKTVLGPDFIRPYDEEQDGSKFWVLSRDPTLGDRETLSRGLDRPAYRAQRILYPALASPWRLGGESGLFWGLVLTNLAVVFGGSVLTTLLAFELGVAARVGYAFALNPVTVLAFVLDLSDALAAACVIGVVLAVRRERWAWAVLAAVAGALAKESSWLAVVCVAAVAAGPKVKRAVLAAVPALVALAWAAFVRIRLGASATTTGIEEFTAVPFSAYVESYQRGWSVEGRYDEMLIALLVAVVAVVVVVRFVQRRTPELAACLPYCALLPFYSSPVIHRSINSMRTLGPVVTLLALDVYAERRARTRSLRTAVA